MAQPKTEYYFTLGRISKFGRRDGPGILVVGGKYKFKVNQTNKDKTRYTMYCVMQGNPEFACRAKATVLRRDDGSFYLYSCDREHNHFVSEAII